ncbi:MAG TPA: hypothetical protein VIT22_09490 [Pseudoxanthomonas sp.]
MNPNPVAHRLPRLPVRHATPWLLLGGVTAAFLDLSFAAIYWTTLHGSSTTQVLQSIASWVLGANAFTGGSQTAALGAALYAYLMCVLTALYHAAAGRYPVLLRRPLACGAAYGMGMYLLIFKFIVPNFTAAPAQPPSLTWTLVCVVAYAVLIGIPCALFTRIARR